MPKDGKCLFNAVVLAGDRLADDPLLAHTGMPCKAVIPVAGRAMLLRVLDSLTQAGTIDQLVLSGPRQEHLAGQDEINALIGRGNPQWHPPGPSPSSSAYAVLDSLPPGQAVLITTADHVLLSPALIDEFCQRGAATGADVVVGLAPYALVKKGFPELRKTVLRFRDGNFCSCNLFAFLTDRGRVMADHWRTVEAERKNPRKLIGLLGLWAVIAYRLGWLSLDGALERLSQRFNLRLAAVVLEYAEAAVDVDSIADHTILERSLRITESATDTISRISPAEG